MTVTQLYKNWGQSFFFPKWCHSPLLHLSAICTTETLWCKGIAKPYPTSIMDVTSLRILCYAVLNFRTILKQRNACSIKKEANCWCGDREVLLSHDHSQSGVSFISLSHCQGTCKCNSLISSVILSLVMCDHPPQIGWNSGKAHKNEIIQYILLLGIIR